MLNNGADVNAEDLLKYRPLSRAVENGHKEVEELLRQRGGLHHTVSKAERFDNAVMPFIRTAWIIGAIGFIAILLRMCSK